jgi:hypothetical protein
VARTEKSDCQSLLSYCKISYFIAIIQILLLLLSFSNSVAKVVASRRLTRAKIKAIAWTFPFSGKPFELPQLD